MCGRFATRSKSWPEIFSAMDITAPRDREGEVRANFNLGPMQKTPIIASDGSKIRAVTATWSLIPTWWKQDLGEKKFSTFNAKSETITTTKSFNGPIKSLRWLVPAHAYYEWKREGKVKQGASAIGLNDQSMFAMAGIWTYWKGTYKQKDWEGYSFSILTCKPNPLTADVHHRMPVILHKDTYEDWLHAPVKQALNLTSPYRLRKWRSGKLTAELGNSQRMTKACWHRRQKKSPMMRLGFCSNQYSDASMMVSTRVVKAGSAGSSLPASSVLL